jgi:hypothetical protein
MKHKSSIAALFACPVLIGIYVEAALVGFDWGLGLGSRIAKGFNWTATASLIIVQLIISYGLLTRHREKVLDDP